MRSITPKLQVAQKVKSLAQDHKGRSQIQDLNPDILALSWAVYLHFLRCLHFCEHQGRRREKQNIQKLRDVAVPKRNVGRSNLKYSQSGAPG